jgi:hypothetical protein
LNLFQRTAVVGCVSAFRIKMAAVAVCVLAAAILIVAAVGAGSAPASQPLHHHRCIPQHNRGDHDLDNRGGPSDGDGCR